MNMGVEETIYLPTYYTKSFRSCFVPYLQLFQWKQEKLFRLVRCDLCISIALLNCH